MDKNTELLTRWWDRDKVPVVISSRSSDNDAINAAIQLILEDLKAVEQEDDLAIMNREKVPKMLTSIEEGDIYKPMTKEGTMNRKTAEAVLYLRKKTAQLEADLKALHTISRRHTNTLMKKEAGKSLNKLLLALGLIGGTSFLGAKEGSEAMQPNSGSWLRDIANRFGMTDPTVMEANSGEINARKAELERMYREGEIGDEDYRTGLDNIVMEQQDKLDTGRRVAADDAEYEKMLRLEQKVRDRGKAVAEDEYVQKLKNLK